MWPDAIIRGLVLDIDEIRMAQVLRNLVSNALKFSPAGGVVRVAAETVMDPPSPSSLLGLGLSPKKQRFLRVTVIDSGAGIAQVSDCVIQLLFATFV